MKTNRVPFSYPPFSYPVDNLPGGGMMDRSSGGGYDGRYDEMIDETEGSDHLTDEQKA
jgi:hypothetical protein